MLLSMGSDLDRSPCPNVVGDCYVVALAVDGHTLHELGMLRGTPVAHVVVTAGALRSKIQIFRTLDHPPYPWPK